MNGTTSGSSRTRALWAMIGVVGLMGGPVACDDDDDFTGPTVGVTAVRDQAFDFTKMRTFAMPDTVVHYAPLTGTPLEVSRQFDRAALDEVRQNLLLRGYTQVADPSTTRPDFVVLVGATATTNYDAWVAYPWYGYWGFYSGWDWYAPGFTSTWSLVYPWYPVVGVTAYDRGTMLVTMVPTLSVNPVNTSINASWAGVATALLNGTVTDDVVAAAVDRMFELSPYLTAAPATASLTRR